METLTLAQLADRVDVGPNLDLYVERRVLWTDVISSFTWCGRTVYYVPRITRAHLEPIEDEE